MQGDVNRPPPHPPARTSSRTGSQALSFATSSSSSFSFFFTYSVSSSPIFFFFIIFFFSNSFYCFFISSSNCSFFFYFSSSIFPLAHALPQQVLFLAGILSGGGGARPAWHSEANFHFALEEFISLPTRPLCPSPYADRLCFDNTRRRKSLRTGVSRFCSSESSQALSTPTRRTRGHRSRRK